MKGTTSLSVFALLIGSTSQIQLNKDFIQLRTKDWNAADKYVEENLDGYTDAVEDVFEQAEKPGKKQTKKLHVEAPAKQSAVIKAQTKTQSKKEVATAEVITDLSQEEPAGISEKERLKRKRSAPSIYHAESTRVKVESSGIKVEKGTSSGKAKKILKSSSN